MRAPACVVTMQTEMSSAISHTRSMCSCWVMARILSGSPDDNRQQSLEVPAVPALPPAAETPTYGSVLFGGRRDLHPGVLRAAAWAVGERPAVRGDLQRDPDRAHARLRPLSVHRL